MTEHHMKQFVLWALRTFKDATAFTSLIKLVEEISEVEKALYTTTNKDEIAEEYADCFMCLLHSAAAAGISPDRLTTAFANKLYKNVARKWKKNKNNTYSHID